MAMIINVVGPNPSHQGFHCEQKSLLKHMKMQNKNRIKPNPTDIKPNPTEIKPNQTKPNQNPSK